MWLAYGFLSENTYSISQKSHSKSLQTYMRTSVLACQKWWCSVNNCCVVSTPCSTTDYALHGVCCNIIFLQLFTSIFTATCTGCNSQMTETTFDCCQSNAVVSFTFIQINNKRKYSLLFKKVSRNVHVDDTVLLVRMHLLNVWYHWQVLCVVYSLFLCTLQGIKL